MDEDESVDLVVVVPMIHLVTVVGWDNVCRSRLSRTALVAAKVHVFGDRSGPRVGRTLAGGARHPLARSYALSLVQWIRPMGDPTGDPMGGPIGDPIGGPIGDPMGGPIGDPMGDPIPIGVGLR
ncbi:transcription factor mef2A [Venturia nashicola]|nr:transcription factor mef2A [Venturia nashicola]